jgi:serine/threonine protein kinase
MNGSVCHPVQWANPLTYGGIFQLVLLVFVRLFLRWHELQLLADDEQDDEVAVFNSGVSGSSSSIQWLVLPIYIRFMYCFFAVYGLASSVNLLCGGQIMAQTNPWQVSLFNGLAWGANHSLVDGLTFFLMHVGAGWGAVWRAVKMAAAWGLITAVTVFFMFWSAGNWVVLIWNGVQFAFYFTVAVSPVSFIFQRPALRVYAIYNCVLRGFKVVWCFVFLLIYTGTSLSLPPPSAFNSNTPFSITGGAFPRDELQGLYHVLKVTDYIYLSLFFIGLPLVLLRTLSVDSAYWMGTMEVDTAQFAQGQLTSTTMPGVPVLNPLSRASAVVLLGGLSRSGSTDSEQPFDAQLIPWPRLKVNAGKLLGQGGTSRVLEGVLARRRQAGGDVKVAVKTTYLFEITPGAVDNFAAEAKLLSNLVHPNVVTVFGIVVVPPTLCLVLELMHGSLRDLIDERGPTGSCAEPVLLGNPTSSSRLHGSLVSAHGLLGTAASWEESLAGDTDEGGVSPEDAPRSFSDASQVTDWGESHLTLTDRLNLCLDCAEAVRFLHSRGIVHVDIKSLNFLVHESSSSGGPVKNRWVAKVCDLEFAFSPSSCASTDSSGVTVPNAPTWLAPELIQQAPSITQEARESAAAPEEARVLPTFCSDVYSLAIVIWEVLSLSQEMPFGKEEEEADLVGMQSREWLANAIRDGLRPIFPSSVPSDDRAPQAPASFQAATELAVSMWSLDPLERPVMDAVVEQLRECVRMSSATARKRVSAVV